MLALTLAQMQRALQDPYPVPTGNGTMDTFLEKLAEALLTEAQQEQVQEILKLWRACRYSKERNMTPTSNQSSWHEPSTSTIHLKNGQTAQANINGLDFDGTTGYAFTGGREIKVRRIEETDEWMEVDTF